MSSGKKASEEMSVLSFSVEKILSPTEASETKTEIVPRSKKRSLEDAHEDVDDHGKHAEHDSNQQKRVGIGVVKPPLFMEVVLTSVCTTERL